MSPRAAPSSRRARALDSFRTAAECIGPITPGLSLFAITRGQFSMIDIILHVQREIGPCYLSLWTWAIADYEVEVFTRLLKSREFLGAGLIVDYSAGRRNRDLLDGWRDRYGDDTVKVCMNHSKIARAWNIDRRVLMRGSCNLNFNPRFEQIDITEGGPDFDLVSEIESGIPVLPRDHSKMEAKAASGLNKSFDLGDLRVFEVPGVWRP